MQIKLNRALTHTLNSLPRGRLHSGSIKNSCNVPQHHATIDTEGNIFLCSCDAWLPIPIGTVDDFDSLDSVWESENAKFLQQNIKDKKFTWCAIEHCGILHRSISQKKHTLSINIDDSCNLSCPSCRRELRMLDQGSEFDRKLQQFHRVIEWLNNFEKPIRITLSGNGDPLASKITRDLFKSYIPRPTHTIELKTNGLLIKKLIDSSPAKKSIDTYAISIDAATAQVYETVRRPGKWTVLLENLEWLKHNRGTAKVMLDFVIQKNNLDDVMPFVELCNQYGFWGNFSALVDWGTWNSTSVLEPDVYTIKNGTFLDHDVANPNHPDHAKFVTIINDLYNANAPHIIIASFFKKFINVTKSR